MNTMRRGGWHWKRFLEEEHLCSTAWYPRSSSVGARLSDRSRRPGRRPRLRRLQSAEGLDECNENGTPPPEGKPDALDERSTPHARKQEQNRRPERSRRQICARPTRTRGRASVRLVDRTIHAIRNPFVGVSERPPKSTQFELRWIKTRWRKRAIKSAGENRGRTRIGLNI